MLPLNKLDSYAKEILGERFERNTEEILRCLEANFENLNKEFRKTFDQLFLLCATMQQSKAKGKIAYLHIFYLKSAILTDKYELQINLYDQNSYADQVDCSCFWLPELFTPYYKKDMEVFRKKAKENVFGFGYSHYQEIKMKYYDMYIVLIGQFLRKEIEQITMLSSFQTMEKEEDIRIIFGGYMDIGLQIYPPMEVKICDTF